MRRNTSVRDFDPVTFDVLITLLGKIQSPQCGIDTHGVLVERFEGGLGQPPSNRPDFTIRTFARG